MARTVSRAYYKLEQNEYLYSTALLDIATAQRKAGEMQQLMATLQEFEQAIESFDETQDLNRHSLALVRADAGLLDEALKTARTIDDATKRDETYWGIASSLAHQGRWQDALTVAKSIAPGDASRSAEEQVMGVLAETGRREWVREALPILKPSNEAALMVTLELRSGNYAAARDQVRRIADPSTRMHILEQIVTELNEKDLLDETLATARWMPIDAAQLQDEYSRSVYYKYGAELLAGARAFDEALALVPKVRTADRPELLRDIAIQMALSGDYRSALPLLKSLDSEQRQEVLSIVAAAKVIANDEPLAQALAPLRDDYGRLEALELMADLLPANRQDDARAALRQAVKIAATVEMDDRDLAFSQHASLQARWGFFDDALQTALGMRNTEELVAAYADIGIAQAKAGLIDQARRTFVIAEAQARKYGFTGDDHAALTAAMATAGLLPEAFAQVQAMSRRDRDDNWYDQELDPVIQGYLKAGQPTRAFEIANQLSHHDGGNAHYFLVIAESMGR